MQASAKVEDVVEAMLELEHVVDADLDIAGLAFRAAEEYRPGEGAAEDES